MPYLRKEEQEKQALIVSFKYISELQLWSRFFSVYYGCEIQKNRFTLFPNEVIIFWVQKTKTEKYVKYKF